MKKQQFILYVNDLYSVKEFYQDVFDFNIKEMMHSLNDVSHVILIKDGVELQLLQSNYTKDPTSKAKKIVSLKPVFIVNESMARYRNTSISSGAHLIVKIKNGMMKGIQFVTAEIQKAMSFKFVHSLNGETKKWLILNKC